MFEPPASTSCKCWDYRASFIQSWGQGFIQVRHSANWATSQPWIFQFCVYNFVSLRNTAQLKKDTRVIDTHTHTRRGDLERMLFWGGRQIWKRHDQMLLTRALKSIAPISLLAFALEGSWGIEAIGMEAAHMGIQSTLIYIWKGEHSSEQLCDKRACWKSSLFTWATSRPTTQHLSKPSAAWEWRGVQNQRPFGPEPWLCLVPVWYVGKVHATHLLRATSRPAYY